VLPRGHLDAVAAHGHRRARRVGEPHDDRRDPLGVEHRGHLAAARVGHRRRRVQRPAGVGRGALPARVPETREHERPVRPARRHDRRPAVGARRGQRRVLVGVVVRDDRRDLGDDHPGAPGGAGPVVRDVAGPQRPRPSRIGEVRDVRTEQHSTGRGPPADHDGVAQHIGPR
jgi:hypothetical protein